MHVSTAYSNSEKSRVEEKVYDPPAQLHHLLSLLDVVPQPILSTITSK